MRSRVARVVIAGVAAACLVGVPLAGLTETSAERSLKQRLGLVDDPADRNCQPTRPSPGWSDAGSLPAAIDEPRAVSLDGAIYLAGGIERIVDFGEPSDVPGVRERVEVESSRQLLRFDPATGEYERLPPMPEPLNHIGFVEYDGDLYVVGGHGSLLGGADPRREFFRYSPATRAWSAMPPMRIARGAVAAGVIGDRLYVAGGLARGRPLTTVEAFDFGDGRWHDIAPLPEPREHIAGAVLDGALYVIGGRNAWTDSLPVVERYDPETDRWEQLPDLPVASGGLEAVPFDGAIIAMGGGDDRRRFVTPVVQRFEPATERWTEMPPMRSPRHGFAAARVDERIFTFGGSPCPLFAASDIVDVLEPRRSLEARE
jgi:hypothetical protein